MRPSLNIHSTSTGNHKSCAGSSLLTETQPSPSRSLWTRGGREAATPSLGDTETLNRGSQHSPTEHRVEPGTRSCGVRASRTCVEPEKMSWCRSGLAEAREEGRRECVPGRGRGTHEGAEVRGDRALRRGISPLSWSISSHQTLTWKVGEILHT